MANGNGGFTTGPITKADLQDAIDEAVNILTQAYVPEASREDLASAVGDALSALQGDDDGDDDDADDGDVVDDQD
jgi:hypothetical protein